MNYRSTRGGVAGVGFTDSLMMGLGADGGLLVPETIPDVTPHLGAWRELDFVALAKEVIALFVDDIERERLDALIDEAYASFSHPEIVAVKELGSITLLELFHGPTLAFKDVALQLLGQLFAHVLAQRGERLTILGATSGDTGSAAIAAVQGQPNIDIFILYPNGRVSPLQERQMTTVADTNVHCLAVDGSFDDCQNLMKTGVCRRRIQATLFARRGELRQLGARHGADRVLRLRESAERRDTELLCANWQLRECVCGLHG